MRSDWARKDNRFARPFCHMITIADLFLLSLATWRVSSLLVNEAGPNDYLARMRYWVGVRCDENSGASYGKNVISDMLLCVWCVSIWVGLLFYIFYVIWPVGARVVASPFAISAIAIVVDRLTSKE